MARSRFVVGLVLATTVIVGCSDGPVVPLGAQDAAIEDPVPFETPPPALPRPPRPRPLANFPGSVPVDPSLGPQAVGGKVALRLLVVGASPDDVGVAALEALLDQVGVPYETLIGSQETLTWERLVDADGIGRFQGVLLTSNNLSYFDGMAWQSAFDADEWNTLWSYEREYGVRQVSLYTYPSSWPEDYGIAFAGVHVTMSDALPASLTRDGQRAFDYLQRTARVPIRYAYTYLAAIDPASTSFAVTPLFTDPSGNVLGVTSVSADGRERLALTFSNGRYLVHTELVGYGLLRWVTRGVFLGERSLYFMADVDDWFLPNDVWDVDTDTVLPEAYRLTARDVQALSRSQTDLRNRYRQAQEFTVNLAYNGIGANTAASASCNPNARSVDPLTSVSRCLRDSFRWLNHSYSHEYFDFLSYDDSRFEIRENRQVATRLGIRQPNRVLITGDVSGLGWYNEDGEGPKTDHGLGASNPQFLAAARSLNVNVVASNASVPSHAPDCWGCGVYHPLEPSILLVPRWPTNVFYMVMTPQQMADAYNAVYGPNGAAPYWDHDLSYEEILEAETEIALYHVLTFSPYPHFFHAANTYEYAPGRSILHDFLERLFARYADYYRLDLRSPDWSALANRVADRTSFMHSRAAGVWDRSANTVTVTTPVGGTIFLTGARTGDVTLYGGEPTSRFTLPAGGSRTVAVPALPALTGADELAGTLDVTDDDPLPVAAASEGSGG